MRLPLPVLALLVLLAIGLTACAPPLDWRTTHPDGWSIDLSLPCRAATHERQLPLAGQTVAMAMVACSAGGHTFAVSRAQLGDPAAVGPALQAMGLAARTNLGDTGAQGQPVQVPGMTPQAQAQRWLTVGQLPDGQPVRAQTWVFAHGLAVYQATVLGPKGDAEAFAPFFEALRVTP